MKKTTLVVSILLFALWADTHAQTDAEKLKSVRDLVENYRTLCTFSSTGGTIDENAMDQFRGLFEPAATLYWDLYTHESALHGTRVIVNQYIDSVWKYYTQKAPVITIQRKVQYIKQGSGNTWWVYLVKENQIQNDAAKDKLTVLTHRLKMIVAFQPNGEIRIRNIVKDERVSRIRSVSLAGGYPLYDNLTVTLGDGPVSGIDPYMNQPLNVKASGLPLAGIMTDIRLNNEERKSVCISTGIFVQQTKYTLQTGAIEIRTLDTIDASSPHPFTLTVFDRTSGIREEVTLTRVSIPITVKKYFGKYFYGRLGLQLTLNTARFVVADYLVSHTGGGVVTSLNDPGQTFYIDPENELSDIYGFYKDKLVLSFSGTPELTNPGGSVLMAVGIEKDIDRKSRFSIAIEPFIRIGTNPVYQSNPSPTLDISNTSSYKGLLSTCETQSWQMDAGIQVGIHYQFNR